MVWKESTQKIIHCCKRNVRKSKKDVNFHQVRPCCGENVKTLTNGTKSMACLTRNDGK